MIRYLEAGESHGKGLVAIIEGLPAGISVNIDAINRQLARRQGGHGRGKVFFHVCPPIITHRILNHSGLFL